MQQLSQRPLAATAALMRPTKSRSAVIGALPKTLTCLLAIAFAGLDLDHKPHYRYIADRNIREGEPHCRNNGRHTRDRGKLATVLNGE